MIMMVHIWAKYMVKSVQQVYPHVWSEVEGLMYTLEIMVMFKAIVANFMKRVSICIAAVFLILSVKVYANVEILLLNHLNDVVTISLYDSEGQLLANEELQVNSQKSISVTSNELITCIVSEKPPFFIFTAEDSNQYPIRIEVGKKIRLINSNISKSANRIDSIWVCGVQEIQGPDYKRKATYYFGLLEEEILKISIPEPIDILTSYLFELDSEEERILSLSLYQKVSDKLIEKFPSYDFPNFKSGILSRQQIEIKED
jgi:hypothetical protein